MTVSVKTVKTPSVAAVAPAVPPKRRGPRPKGESERLREKILDCAEKLFAEHGFHGTSIRDIAALSEVQLALVGYHFGSKEDLLDSVLGRRATVCYGERMTFLEEARKRYGKRPIPVGELFDGFAACFLARPSRNDAGWRNYATLVANLANAAQWGSLISKHYDDGARAYVKELQRSYPNADSEKIHQAFFFMIAVMLAVCARPGRIERLSEMQFKSSEVTHLARSVSLFVEGGFHNLVASSVRARP
ncbi:TetR/AcrR family transcriptional regulator [Ottowia thiooxydans]|uniref:AcrR family transcriptional regulator n=1 Tax=Ottowia thiooxydans TaxID=219182 RepID=A0ABV2Q664_9BURK